MNILWFVLISTLISIIPNPVTATRSVDAWPKDFNVTKLTTYHAMKEHFAAVTSEDSEDDIGVYIQRRVFGKIFKNGTEDKDRNILYAPISIFIVGPKRHIRFTAIGVAIASCVIFLVLTVVLGWAMSKIASRVYVKNLHDENKPTREMPAAVTWQHKHKKLGKSPIENTPPEKPDSEEAKGIKEKK